MSESSNGTLTRTVSLPDGVDLHARPAGAAGAHRRRPARDDHAAQPRQREADAKSILQVLALGATGGSEVDVDDQRRASLRGSRRGLRPARKRSS